MLDTTIPDRVVTATELGLDVGSATTSTDGGSSSTDIPTYRGSSSSTDTTTSIPTPISSSISTASITSSDGLPTATDQASLMAYYAKHSNCTTGGVPMPLQNSTQWTSAGGCFAGFYCANNTVDHPPEYCPPVPLCQDARLSGGTCPPQGFFEPVICDAGYYCPPGGAQKLRCPAGYFCPQGSVNATKCSAGASCPEGSVQNRGFFPILVLLAVDMLLITFVIANALRNKVKRSRGWQAKTSKKAFLAGGAGRFRGRNYQEINHNSEGFANGDVQMESRTVSPHWSSRSSRIPTGFQQLGSRSARSSVLDQTSKDEGQKDLRLFVESLSKCLGANTFGLSFEFQGLSFKPPKSNKFILSDVSGTIQAGSLWGVMGASGAGKSTFVNVLMGKTAHTEGVTKVNGVAGKIAKYKKIIGYVPQDDIVLPEMTVRENILHSARIRLPCNWSDSEIQNHVDILISCLQLSHVKDSLVGSTAAPVISGGQRKRVSIGMELAAAPMALFLDEPTSGLDSTAAASIMATLKALSRLGMTIVTIIHQPRQEIFESLDSLVLLGSGRMIYCGLECEIQPYLEGRGFHFPDHANPADVMGDIIAGEGRHYKPRGDASVDGLINDWQSRHASNAEEPKTLTVSMAEMNALSHTIQMRGAPWPKQIHFCFCRSIVQQYRLKSSFFFELGVGAMAGFLIGLAELNQKGKNFRGIFYEPYDVLSSSIDYSSIPQMSLLVGLAIGLTASAPGVKIFGEEKLVYWREAAAGHNRFAYYVGKVLSTLPRMILANFHFTTLFILLSTPRISYTSSFIANLLYFYCIYGLASCISMATRREDGPLLAVMLSLIVGVLSGMSPTLAKVRSWHMQWLWRSSPGTWLAEAYFDENVAPLAYLYQIDMARSNMGYHLNQFGHDLVLLFLIGTVYRIAAFLGLRFMWKNKYR